MRKVVTSVRFEAKDLQTSSRKECGFDSAKPGEGVIYRYATCGRGGRERVCVYGCSATFDVHWLLGKGKGLKASSGSKTKGINRHTKRVKW